MIVDLDPQLSVADITAISEEPIDGFDRVVSVCQETREDNVGVPYEHFCMSDGDDHYGGECSYQIVARASYSVLNALERGERVLVHCHAGRSRSVTVATAALGMRRQETFGYVLDQIRDIHDDARPNETLQTYGRWVVTYHWMDVEP